jgi:hypothetical protein
MEGTFKKTDKINRVLFRITTEEKELKIEEKLSAKVLAIHRGCVITFSPTLSWVKT